MPTDVSDLPIDALTCCGFKWLLGPYGTGFVWIGQPLLEQLERYQCYWLAMPDPNDAAPRLDYRVYDRQDAGGFDVFGTANFLNYMPWLASIEYLQEQGLRAVAEHNHYLVSNLVEGLASLGYRLISPAAAERNSAVVVFSDPDRSRNVAIHEGLRSRGYDLSLRGGCLRASPHLYNAGNQIRAFLHALRDI